MTEQELGFISIRNQDGTQWRISTGEWGPKALRRASPKSIFEELQKRAPETTENNCPDNGYYGLINLTFHPCTKEEAHEQEIQADAEERRLDQEFEDYFGEDDHEFIPDEHYTWGCKICGAPKDMHSIKSEGK